MIRFSGVLLSLRYLWNIQESYPVWSGVVRTAAPAYTLQQKTWMWVNLSSTKTNRKRKREELVKNTAVLSKIELGEKQSSNNQWISCRRNLGLAETGKVPRNSLPFETFRLKFNKLLRYKSLIQLYTLTFILILFYKLSIFIFTVTFFKVLFCTKTC